MAERRLLILDDCEVIMVVKKDVIEQVDEYRGELTRTEFVNVLIQSQLKQISGDCSYVDQEEFQRFAQGMKELMRNFLEVFLSYGLEPKKPDDSFAELSSMLKALDSYS